jgi:hypothetical protein
MLADLFRLQGLQIILEAEKIKIARRELMWEDEDSIQENCWENHSAISPS